MDSEATTKYPYFSEESSAEVVIARMSPDADPRFREIMSSVIRHLHAVVKEVRPTQDEWMAAIQFLTDTGKMCDEKRQEFILLSDTLGISMLVVAIEQAKAAAKHKPKPGEKPATEATVLGPFFWPGAPELENGADIGQGNPGTPAYYSGRVTDPAGRPIEGCVIDVWSGDGEGFYDMQKGPDAGMALRARFRTDAQGHYSFWSIRPAYYPVPDDGPVGKMLRRTGRHPNRPGHMHTMLEAPGFEKLVTHLFVSDSPFIESDVVFGVRNSLVVDFEPQPAGKAQDGRVMETPYHTCSYDFVLVPKA
jgi:hydroxyquinol 1,2-dioxygenase